MLLLQLWLAFAALAQQSPVDSLRKVMADGRLPVRERTEALIQLYERLAPSNEAMEFIKTAHDNALRLGDEPLIVRSGKYLGFALMDRGEQSSAVEQLKAVLPLSRRSNLDDQTRSILNGIGIAFGDFGSYDSALFYHFQSLELREQSGDKRAVSVSLNNIGVIYYRAEDPERALEFLIASLNLKNEVNYRVGYPGLLVNIGLCYFQKGEYANAEKYARMALTSCEEECRSISIARAHHLVALIELRENKLESSENSARSSIEINREVNDELGLLENEVLLAKISLKRRDFEEIEERVGPVISSGFVKYTYPQIYLDACRVLIESYDLQKNYQKSAEIKSHYIAVNDSIFGAHHRNRFAKIQAIYEERANLKTIREQAEVLQLKEEIIRRQQLQNVFIGIIACLGATLTYLLFRFLRALQRKRTDLSVKNRQLTEAQEALRNVTYALDQLVEERTKDLADVNRELAATNEELDYFIYKTSHDIRGPLATLIGLAHLGKLEVNEPTARSYLAQIDGTATRLNQVVGKLALINQINRNDPVPAAIDPEQMVTRILQRHVSLLPANTVRTRVVVSPGISLQSDEALLDICLDNLISNAVKYRAESTRVEPFVEVHVEQKLQVVRFRVIDNGIGLASIPAGQLFRMFVRASEKSQTGGVGLYLAKLSATRIYGKLHHSRTDEGHTVFSLLLPIDLSQRMAQLQASAEEKKKQEAVVRARVQTLASEVL